jgi:hypothetical protein
MGLDLLILSHGMDTEIEKKKVKKTKVIYCLCGWNGAETVLFYCTLYKKMGPFKL